MRTTKDVRDAILTPGTVTSGWESLLAADLADAVGLLVKIEALLRDLGYRGQAEAIATFLREPQGEATGPVTRIQSYDPDDHYRVGS